MSQSPPAVQGPSVAERARAGELVGSALAVALAAEPSLGGIDLTGANLDGADLAGLSMFKARLCGASLRNADLSGAELSGADLAEADLEGCRLVGAGLGMANLTKVNAFNANLADATLAGADLTNASFSCATLVDARMREAILTGADLRSADLRGAELSECGVGGACFDDADLRGARLRGITEFETAQWFGVDIRDINFAGAYRFNRHVIDENYLREFREAGALQHRVYQVWKLTSDCGRSIRRWTVVIFAVTAVFALLYSLVGLSVGVHEPGLITYFYYSVVTLTTLGYGDIVPTTSLGQVLVIAEVCVGYMMLGGLISIFANKMARRGE